MNFRLETTGRKLKGAELEVERSDGETADPSPALVSASRDFAAAVAKELGGDVSVSIIGHETTRGRGFRPGHVSVTVSKLDPKRDKTPE